MTARFAQGENAAPPIDVSVVILNYNVRVFLENCLTSVQKACEGLATEVFVVDNASSDDSVDMVQRKYPFVHLIVHDQNLGFSRGNNVALRRCRGRYVLVLNPDTLVQENTIRAMIEFMDACPDAGAAGCKVLNPDGSLQLTCKRSFPSPWVAFTKISGLSRIFPKSRLFGRYNLTYLDEDRVHEVDAIAGSFMFLRREMFDTVGLLDESFFMYGEDLDWCFRMWEKGWKIYYVPTTQIIHYKGESTSRSGFDDIRAFYEAMEIFVEKHFKWQYSLGLVIFLKLAIWFRAMVAVFSRLFRKSYAMLLDALLINASVVLGIYAKYRAFITPDWIGTPVFFYTTIHATATIVWIGIMAALGNYGRRRLSISQSLMASVIGFFVISTLSLFSKDFVFSRMSLLVTSGFVTFFLVSWRVVGLLVARRGTRSSLWTAKVFKRNTLIVGADESARDMARRIRSRFDSPYHVVGHVSVAGEGPGAKESGCVGDMGTLVDVIRRFKVAEVIIASSRLSNQDIMQLIQLLSGMDVQVKLVPRGSEVVIGKSHITRMEDITMIAVDSELQRPFNRFLKRSLDLTVSTLILPLLFPAHFFAMLCRRVNVRRVAFSRPGAGVQHHTVRTTADGIISRWSLCRLVWIGALSFVGPKFERRADDHIGAYTQKPGLFSLADVTVPADEESRETIAIGYDNYYAQNYSLKMDIEIITRAVLRL